MKVLFFLFLILIYQQQKTVLTTEKRRAISLLYQRLSSPKYSNYLMNICAQRRQFFTVQTNTDFKLQTNYFVGSIFSVKADNIQVREFNFLYNKIIQDFLYSFSDRTGKREFFFQIFSTYNFLSMFVYFLKCEEKYIRHVW